jgi:di/tricarboxylate transporter
MITVLAVLIAVLVLLWRRVFPPPVVFLAAVAVLTATGLLTPLDALAGFANESIAVMIMLISVSTVIRKTRVLEWLFESRLRPSSRYRSFLAQLMPFVAGTSSFMNNTPAVAMLIPAVRDWGKRHGVALSRLLIPLSYAAILGGMTTLVGTSTNLIVNSLSEESGAGSLSVLDFTPVGLMMLGAGLLYILLHGYRLLPSRTDPTEGLMENPREYLVETVVSAGSELVGKTVEDARLRNLRGLFLTEIVRDGRRVVPVEPGEVLEENDTLILAGDTSTVADLVTGSRGLSLGRVADPPFRETSG